VLNDAAQDLDPETSRSHVELPEEWVEWVEVLRVQREDQTGTGRSGRPRARGHRPLPSPGTPLADREEWAYRDPATVRLRSSGGSSLRGQATRPCAPHVLNPGVCSFAQHDGRAPFPADEGKPGAVASNASNVFKLGGSAMRALKPASLALASPM